MPPGGPRRLPARLPPAPRPHGYGCALYGHFGEGCVHTRIDFDLVTAPGLRAFRAFVEEAADLVVRHGGSLSGEHGDGQARAELLPKMFGPELVAAFREFKAIWDPDGKMNPGKVVDPYRLDENLRLGTGYKPAQPHTALPLPRGRRQPRPRGAALRRRRRVPRSSTAARCARATW